MKTIDRSPWLAHPAAVPLRSWSGSQLQACVTRLQSAVQRWATDWGLQDVATPVAQCAAAADAAAWNWQAIGRRQSAAAWLAQADDVPSWIAHELFDAAGQDAPILKAVCQACAHDLRPRLAAALDLEEDGFAPPPRLEQLGPWHGAVIATLSGGVLVLATGACVAACIGSAQAGTSKATRAAPAASLARIDEALAGCEISLQVMLQPCELDVATLQRLQPGDVVRLPHGLARPLSIGTRAAGAAFAGALVRVQGAKAVELVSPGSLS